MVVHGRILSRMSTAACLQALLGVMGEWEVVRVEWLGGGCVMNTQIYIIIPSHTDVLTPSSLMERVARACGAGPRCSHTNR